MSKQFTALAVEHRENKKIESVKKLRKMNYIPAIIFGEKKESESIKVTTKNWKALTESKELIFSVQKGDNKELVSLSSVEINNYGKPLHLSLQRVKRNVLTEVMLPVKQVGERKSSDSSVIQQNLSEVKIQAIPTNIPNDIEVEITNLVDGDIIRLSDLKLPKGVQLMDEDTKAVVLECNIPHVAQEIEAEVLETTETPKVIAEEAKE